MSLPERIRKCAELIGSGDELARQSGVPRSSLETYLTGKAEPKAGRIAAICHATGVSGHWLVTGEGPMLLTDISRDGAQTLVNAERLAQALAAVEKIATARRVTLSKEKHSKLAVLVYQYFMLNKAESETAAYLSQLMELVSNN